MLEDDCTVCFEYAGDEKSQFLTPCQHIFHRECLLRWFTTCEAQRNAKTCPMCRRDLSQVLNDMKHDDRTTYLEYAREHGVDIEYRKQNLQASGAVLESIFGSLGINYLNGLTENLTYMIDTEPEFMGCTSDSSLHSSMGGLLGTIIGTVIVNKISKKTRITTHGHETEYTRGVRPNQRRRIA